MIGKMCSFLLTSPFCSAMHGGLCIPENPISSQGQQYFRTRWTFLKLVFCGLEIAKVARALERLHADCSMPYCLETKSNLTTKVSYNKLNSLYLLCYKYKQNTYISSSDIGGQNSKEVEPLFPIWESLHRFMVI